MISYRINQYQSLYLKNITMQKANKISQLYYMLSHWENEADKASKTEQFQIYLEDSSDLPGEISTIFKQRLSSFDPNNIPDLREIIVISERLISIKKYRKLFENIEINQIDNLGEYFVHEKQIRGLYSTIQFTEKMFLDQSMLIYSRSSKLFKAFLQRFQEIADESVLELVTELLVEMMLDNKKLIKLANKPYYFMEYWLHFINQEAQFDRKIYWVESIKKLYSVQNCQEYLFYESDFRTLIDLLLRIGSECPDGKNLRVLLECYLVLTCTKMMMKEPYRLEDVKNFLQCLDVQQFGISDIAQEIKSLKSQ